MLFMVLYSCRPEHRDAVLARFRDTGGVPPEGVRQVGRGHSASMNLGFTLAEADSLEAAAKWCHRWADIISFEVVPVFDDEGLRKVIST
jgi:hypothetical protein